MLLVAFIACIFDLLIEICFLGSISLKVEALWCLFSLCVTWSVLLSSSLSPVLRLPQYLLVHCVN